jgi:hypothetical protein
MGKCLGKFYNTFPDNRFPSTRGIHDRIKEVRPTGSLLYMKRARKRRVFIEEKLDEIGARLEHTHSRCLAQETGISTPLAATACSPAKRLSKLENLGKRCLHLLEVLVGGDDLFIAKTYSCLELTFASCYYRSTSIERMRATVAVMTMTRTPTLQTRQNCTTTCGMKLL